MKLKEAYSILELPSTATPEEAKKKFRELAKKHHPDVNKEAGAEDKFKKINEAYQVIEAGVDEPDPMSWGPDPFRNVHDPFRDPFGPFRSTQRQYFAGNIDVNTTISFKESVQGVKKEIKYARQVKCPHCHGSGNKPINNGCKKCGGRGQVTTQSNGAVFIQTCPECMGRSRTTPCTDCDSKGVLDSDASVHVSIPPAVSDGNILRLNGMGNYGGTLLGLQDQYTDVYVHIRVVSDADMRLVGRDVVSEVTIPLLDALIGTTKKVRTINGDKKISIDARTKNKDEVHLSVGDHNNIKHRVIVNIEYPDDITKLIDALREESK